MIVNKYQGQGGGGTAGVSSLDGRTGALTTKTINGNAILGSGDITISGGTGSEVSYSQTLSAGTEIGQITINGSATTIYAPEGGSSESDVRFITDDSGMTWETHYDENGNINWRKQVTDDYNAIKEIYHRDYVTYTFTHTGTSWDNSMVNCLTVSYGGNSLSLKMDTFWNNCFLDSNYLTLRANLSQYEGYSEDLNFFVRPYFDTVQSKGISDYFPEFYAKKIGEVSESAEQSWIFACPSSYTVSISEITAAGWEYVGTGTTDFTEIGPAGPILLDGNISSNPYMLRLQRYVLSHRYTENFQIDFQPNAFGVGYQRILSAYSYLSSDYGATCNLLYLYDNSQDWNIRWRSSGIQNAGLKPLYALPNASASTLGGIKVGNGLSIDSDGVLSAKVVALSQAEYDALVQAGTVDANTLYIII